MNRKFGLLAAIPVAIGLLATSVAPAQAQRYYGRGGYGGYHGGYGGYGGYRGGYGWRGWRLGPGCRRRYRGPGCRRCDRQGRISGRTTMPRRRAWCTRRRRWCTRPRHTGITNLAPARLTP